MLKSIKNIAAGAGLLILSAITGCDLRYGGPDGYLEGKISIGPLCPVERVPPDPGCLPTAETYKAYPVGVWTANGKEKIATLRPALDGTYNIDLMPGNYLVRLDNRNFSFGSNLPVEVSINSLENTVLDINIDTGIR